MLTCVIVEDEFPAREELKYFLTKHKEISLEKEFENPIDSLKYLQAILINHKYKYYESDAFLLS